MTFNEACKAAYSELGNGFTEILDFGDCWYFWGCDPDIKPLGPHPIIVFKETGKITDWMYFTFVMNRNDKGTPLPIPPEFAYRNNSYRDADRTVGFHVNFLAL